MKLRDPAHDVVVFERNKADDTFGWGVVLSDDALANMQENDPQSANAIRESFAYWDDIAVVQNGVRTCLAGMGLRGLAARRCFCSCKSGRGSWALTCALRALSDPWKTTRTTTTSWSACDGINSAVRTAWAEHFKPDVDVRQCKFVWLGTHQKFDDAFTFIFEKTEAGWVWVHAYQFDEDTATVIVECQQDTWDRLGFEGMSKEAIIGKCEEIFADHLGGHSLISNADHLRGSAVFMNFPRVLCERWHHENVVLLGDASATAHFSLDLARGWRLTQRLRWLSSYTRSL
jgi:anthraniloyl-CoA monooxygenase